MKKNQEVTKSIRTFSTDVFRKINMLFSLLEQWARKHYERLFLSGSLSLLFIFSLLWVFEINPIISSHFSGSGNKANPALVLPDDVLLQKAIKDSKQKISKYRYQLDRYTPGSSYLVINTNENRFFLLHGKRELRQGVCSTGSYTLLKGGTNQEWVFKTPKGIFSIQGKKEAPVWKKPDWAFVEEGQAIPGVNDPSRFEYGVLGDYALALGDGYLIHGTLYKRFLGLPVTHGCIRLNDEDLYAVYSRLDPGSRVFIF